MNLTTFAAEYTKDQKVGFGSERRKTVGASESGLCIRRIAYRKLGLVPDKPDDGNGFATRGNVMEDHFSAPLLMAWAKKLGGELLYAGQSNQISLKSPKSFQSATPDGLLVNIPNDAFADYGLADLGNNTCVVEFKSIDPRVGSHKLPKIENVRQTMQQLGLIRKGTQYKPDWAVIIYTNASDYFDIKVFPVAWNELMFQGLAIRAKTVMACEDPSQLSPEGKIKGGDECKMCEYAEQCLGFLPWLANDESAPAAKHIKPVEALAKQILEAEVVKVKANQHVRDLEALMYEKLNHAKTRFLKTKSVVVVAKKTNSQSRYNMDMMKKRIEQLGGSYEDCKADTKEGTTLSVEYA